MDGVITNVTSGPTFYIFSFFISEYQRLLILITVLLIYVMICSGNLLIISLVSLEPRLHTPMYFFLCNLSTLDIMYVSTTLPKLMYICHTGDHIMSYTSCMTQMYFYMTFTDAEGFLLTSMAIDRYVAVCFPLHYSIIMNKQTCFLLILPAWFMSFLNASIIICFITNLTYFGLVDVANFFCDLKALMNTSSSDASSLKLYIIVNVAFIGFIPSCLILASYVRIIHTILKIKTSVGRWKTFSSCSSHLTIVIVYYESAITLYLSDSLKADVVLSLMFVTLVPMLNPLVYSLRNRDIIRALHIIVHRKTTRFLK
ncbi:hypothetical protein GDO81_008961 [Engystomops pustulosus]|uniref:Olfactory receptor n=1 Tax=Engystomops pustulosus TaxID=76066 RepID=A0AAV7BMP6_ENGPU|nr:hypothetical protein GDO81_008961 [Engystomops pustulosus]